jgi:hypothetical protein
MLSCSNKNVLTCLLVLIPSKINVWNPHSMSLACLPEGVRGVIAMGSWNTLLKQPSGVPCWGWISSLFLLLLNMLKRFVPTICMEAQKNLEPLLASVNLTIICNCFLWLVSNWTVLSASPPPPARSLPLCTRGRALPHVRSPPLCVWEGYSPSCTLTALRASLWNRRKIEKNIGQSDVAEFTFTRLDRGKGHPRKRYTLKG